MTAIFITVFIILLHVFNFSNKTSHMTVCVTLGVSDKRQRLHTLRDYLDLLPAFDGVFTKRLFMILVFWVCVSRSVVFALWDFVLCPVYPMFTYVCLWVVHSSLPLSLSLTFIWSAYRCEIELLRIWIRGYCD